MFRSLLLVLLLALSFPELVAGLDCFPDPGSGRPPLLLSGLSVRANRGAGDVEIVCAVRFRNPSEPASGACLIAPLPKGVRLGPDALRADGRVVPFDFHRPPHAAPMACRLGRELRRTEALHAAGGPFLRALLPSVPAGSEIRIELTYTLAPEPSPGGVEFRIPLLRPGAGCEPESALSIAGQFGDPDAPLRMLASATHTLETERVDERTLRFSCSGRLAESPADLEIAVLSTHDPVAFRAVPFREGTEPGCCLYDLTASENAQRLPALKRDVVIAVDLSSSLAGARLAAVRNAVRAAIDGLEPGDRFALLTFETRVTAWADGMGDAAPARREAALTWLDGQKALGGCALSEAIDRALDLLNAPGRYPLLMLFLDGLPTVGLTKLDEFTSRFEARRAARTRELGIGPRLAAFALGPDVNPRFFDRLAALFRGWRFYPPDAETLEREARTLLRTTRRPLLAEIQSRWTGGASPGEGAVVDPLYEGPPDLFEDAPTAFLGTYAQPGFHFLSLTGQGVDVDHPGRLAPRSFAFGIRLPDADRSHPDVPRLRAARLLARAWDRVRLGLAPRIADVADAERMRRRFGLRFPWLPPETDDVPPAELAPIYGQAGAALANRAARGGLPEMRGAGTLPADESRFLWRLLHDPPTAEGLARLPGAGPGTVAVGGKIFLPRGAGRIDAEAESRGGLEMSALPASAARWTPASPELWDAAARDPDLAACLAVGDDLLLLWNDRLIRVTPR